MSVIVPALDEEALIGRALDHLAALRPRPEVIVADGGSSDATRAVARTHPLRPVVIAAPRGRARQMNAGAAAARGELLLFLHADTRLPPGAGAALAAVARRPRIVGGNFALRFEGRGAFPRALGAWYAAQDRLGTHYGDSAMFARARAFRALGGFPDIPVMEDFELARALRRLGPTRRLPGPAVTSGRRWRRLGVGRSLRAWVLIRTRYGMGVPPERLARMYPPVR